MTQLRIVGNLESVRVIEVVSNVLAHWLAENT